MKGKRTRNGSSSRLHARRRAELAARARRPDERIDTRDIPEVRDWSGARRGLFYRPAKTQLTLRIDADVVDWFKRRAPKGAGYQTAMNRMLREHVERHARVHKAG